MSVLRPNVRFDGGPNAVQRLALVLWWLSLGLAVLIVALGLWMGWLMPRAESGLGVAILVLATCIWVVGRALLYILAGR
jgi:hypothetical protein